MAANDHDTSSTATTVTEYTCSPGVRRRRQVAWADEVDSRGQSDVTQSFLSQLDDHTDDGGSDSMVVEELDRSPSATRRRKRRRRRQRHQPQHDQQQSVESDDESSHNVSNRLLRLDEVQKARVATGELNISTDLQAETEHCA